MRLLRGVVRIHVLDRVKFTVRKQVLQHVGLCVTHMHACALHINTKECAHQTSKSHHNTLDTQSACAHLDESKKRSERAARLDRTVTTDVHIQHTRNGRDHGIGIHDQIGIDPGKRIHSAFQSEPDGTAIGCHTRITNQHPDATNASGSRSSQQRWTTGNQDERSHQSAGCRRSATRATCGPRGCLRDRRHLSLVRHRSTTCN